MMRGRETFLKNPHKGDKRFSLPAPLPPQDFRLVGRRRGVGPCRLETKLEKKETRFFREGFPHFHNMFYGYPR